MYAGWYGHILVYYPISENEQDVKLYARQGENICDYFIKFQKKASEKNLVIFKIKENHKPRNSFQLYPECTNALWSWKLSKRGLGYVWVEKKKKPRLAGP